MIMHKSVTAVVLLTSILIIGSGFAYASDNEFKEQDRKSAPNHAIQSTLEVTDEAVAVPTHQIFIGPFPHPKPYSPPKSKMTFKEYKEDLSQYLPGREFKVSFYHGNKGRLYNIITDDNFKIHVENFSRGKVVLTLGDKY
jgi:hypothetical protein